MAGSAWFFYAFFAALLWGFSYALSEKVLHAGVSASSLMFIYVAIATPIFLIFSLYQNALKESVGLILNDKKLLFFMALILISYIAANFFIFKSMMLKNASLSSLIEISYPVFTIFFSWLLFREVHLNIGTLVGALMIAGGVILIYLKG